MTASIEEWTTPVFDELLVLEAYARTLGDEGTFVDVGAHIGRFSSVFADIGWRVIALEPEEGNFADLQQRLGDNPRARLIRAAAANTSEPTITFHISSKHWGIHSLRPFHESHDSTVTVPAIRLSDLVAEVPADSPLIIKVDAEGADFEVLKGLDLMKRRPELIMTEFMDDRTRSTWGYVAGDVVSHMARHGYACLVSEWAPVESYAERGVEVAPFVHLGLARWPLGHQPSWGNLFFTHTDRIDELETLAVTTLSELNRINSEAIRSADRLADHNAKLQASIVNRERTIETLNRTIATQRDRIDELTDSIGKRKARIDQLGTAVEQRDTRIDQLGLAVQQRDARIGQLDDAVAARAGRIEELQHAVHARDSRIEELQRAVRSRDDRIASLNTHSEQTELALEHLRSRSQEERNAMTDELTRLRQELRQLGRRSTVSLIVAIVACIALVAVAIALSG